MRPQLIDAADGGRAVRSSFRAAYARTATRKTVHSPPIHATRRSPSEGAARHLAAGGARITVIVADDHPLFREGIARALRERPELELVAEAGLPAEVRARGVDDTRPLLTAREREILLLLADGLSAPGIGERLYLSPATVKTHLSHMYEKLGVSDRAACVAEAMRRGLLE